MMQKHSLEGKERKWTRSRRRCWALRHGIARRTSIMWKSADVRRTICLNEDRPYGQSNPRDLLRVPCARLLTFTYIYARYFTEICFSRIVILGVAGKKVIFKDWWMRWWKCVCGGVREVLRWPVGNSSSCKICISICVLSIYIYISFDNSDDVIRLGPHLNICIIYFPHCYIFWCLSRLRVTPEVACYIFWLCLCLSRLRVAPEVAFV